MCHLSLICPCRRRSLPHLNRRKKSSSDPQTTQLILPGWRACSALFPVPAVLECAGSVSAWQQKQPLTFPAAWPWWWSGAPAFWPQSSAPRSQYCSFPYLRTLNCPSLLCRPVLGPADPAINSYLCTTTLGDGADGWGDKQEGRSGHDPKCQGGGWRGAVGGGGGLLISLGDAHKRCWLLRIRNLT